MKRTILCCLAALMAFAASAQIEIVKGSFHQIGANSKEAGEDLGSANLTAMLTSDWPYDTDGNGPAALLRVKFTNLPDAEVSNIQLRVSNSKFVVASYTKEFGGKPERWFFIDPGKNLDLTFSHNGNLGSAFTKEITLESGKTYEITINSSRLIATNFTSLPGGVSVYIDGEHKGTTPLTVELPMGKHNVRYIYGSNNKTTVIDVDEAHNLFNEDMRPRKKVTIRTNEDNARVFIDGVEAGAAGDEFDLPYGPSIVLVKVNDELQNQQAIEVSEASDAIIDIPVYRTRTISFIPMYANQQASGVKLYITDPNGENALRGGQEYASVPGEPITLRHGTYKMLANLYTPNGTTSKSFSLKVNENTELTQTFTLPTKRRSYNPFNIDYHHRTWGLSARYVQKWFSYKDGSKSKKMTAFGESGSMNGIQVGIPIMPYFGKGFGLGTGLYFEYYFPTDIAETGCKIEDMHLYLPVHLQFRLPLAENASLNIAAGIGLDYGIKMSAKFDDDDDDEGSEKVKFNESYEINNGAHCFHTPKAFNYVAELSAGFTWKALRVDVTYSLGLSKNKAINPTNGDIVNSKMNKLAAGISLMF